MITNFTNKIMFIFHRTSKYDRRDGTHFIACTVDRDYLNYLKLLFEADYIDSWIDIDEINPNQTWVEKSGGY